ncbi:hypothetical protein ITP53_44230 [Nonomuraea sp. K274]|uniref:Uncharacterized protein n=1 Tax=Nonomuraea cypriaca TaxID=1187855 RepID=A0A931F5Y3_9ACTN|nr:hypothetical protein [Nonomuraea cypriaca]MBF8192576.1 hypothetical protein [Nonomuraea cypriaca]
MLRRHRLGLPALLVTSVYLIALAFATVIALTAGDLGLLWRLTLLTEAAENAAAALPDVLFLILAGLLWAWALWQVLRGPLAGPAPEPDRNTRWLRVALYAAAASGLLVPLLPASSWWATVIGGVLMWLLMLLFQPVLRRNLKLAGLILAVGVLGFGGVTAVLIFGFLGWEVSTSLLLIGGFACLIWMVMVLRAQGQDVHWQRSTYRYGIASLVAMLLLAPAAGLFGGTGSAYAEAGVVAEILTLIWLVRSAHDLATLHDQQAPAPPLPAQPTTA